MTEENNEERIDPQKLVNIFNITETNLDELYSKSIEFTQYVGFTLDTIKQAHRNFVMILEKKNENPAIEPLISSAYTQITVVNLEVEQVNSNLSMDHAKIIGVSGSAITSCSTSGTVLAALDPEFEYNLEVPSFMKPDENKVEAILYKLDPSLAETYIEIEQVYYGTNADKVRAAISSMRQTFDHFFGILAPDDAVRKSIYWKPKAKEKDPDLVTRRERILYAINTHLKTPSRASSLSQDIKVIIDAYKALNSLHDRGSVNINSAKNALFTVKHFIEDFALSIEK